MFPTREQMTCSHTMIKGQGGSQNRPRSLGYAQGKNSSRKPREKNKYEIEETINATEAINTCLNYVGVEDCWTLATTIAQRMASMIFKALAPRMYNYEQLRSGYLSHGEQTSLFPTLHTKVYTLI
jgi:hypothetical protein